MNEHNTAPAFETPDALIEACLARGGFFIGQFPAEKDRGGADAHMAWLLTLFNRL